MTDKELLEYAAKAAGIGWDLYEGEWYGGGVSPNWNPLTDDGDALRLAVKLNMCVDTGAMTRSNQTYVGGSGGYLADEKHGPDEYAATRRAITRAAAEIGKGVARPVSDDLPEDNYYKSMAEAEETGRAVEIGRKL